jgi:hypothetical protein
MRLLHLGCPALDPKLIAYIGQHMTPIQDMKLSNPGTSCLGAAMEQGQEVQGNKEAAYVT